MYRALTFVGRECYKIVPYTYPEVTEGQVYPGAVESAAPDVPVHRDAVRLGHAVLAVALEAR